LISSAAGLAIPFYINIPAGLLSLFRNGLLVETPGYLKTERVSLLSG